MKKIIGIIGAIALLFIIGMKLSHGQVLGTNGEGLTEKYLPGDVQLISDLGHIAISVPGGASAKNTYARLNVPGYGMRLDSINSWFAKYKADENGEGLEKEIKDYEQDILEPRSYLYDLAEIQNATGCEIIWKVNIFSSPQDVVLTIMDYLSLPGTSISYFELGNELYFIELNGKKFNGAAYVQMCIPYINALQSNFAVPITMNYAQDVSSKSHMEFNREVQNFIKSNPGKVSGVGPHPYLSTSNVLLLAAELHPSYIPGSREEITPIPYSAVFNPALDQCFDTYSNIALTTAYYQTLLDTIHKNLPGIDVITTEWQSNPISLWGDTEANGAYLFYTLTQYRQQFKYFCLHNLLGGYTFALIYNHGVSVKYYALKLANELPLVYYDLTDKINITNSGRYYFRYINSTDNIEMSELIVPDGSYYTITNKGLVGENNYSTMGGAGFYDKKKGSPKQGIDCFYVETEELTQEPNSFGYIIIDVEVPDPPVYGCTDITALNYDPDADTEHIPSNCEYKVCYKKGWLFARRCKPDPNCEKDNCVPRSNTRRAG